MKCAISHDSVVLVADGKKALFLRNEGDEKFPNLKTERVLVDDNPPTHEQGADRPGRSVKNPVVGRRSSMETTDWHELEERKFARRVSSELEMFIKSRQPKSLAISAPPRTLAELRLALHEDVKRLIVLELDKDLTKHSVAEIEKHMFR